jgi:hypothetical protein
VTGSKQSTENSQRSFFERSWAMDQLNKAYYKFVKITTCTMDNKEKLALSCNIFKWWDWRSERVFG